jgi:hypothetical protein
MVRRTEKGEPWGEWKLEQVGRDIEGVERDETPVVQQHREGGRA